MKHLIEKTIIFLVLLTFITVPSVALARPDVEILNDTDSYSDYNYEVDYFNEYQYVDTDYFEDYEYKEDYFEEFEYSDIDYYAEYAPEDTYYYQDYTYDVDYFTQSDTSYQNVDYAPTEDYYINYSYGKSMSFFNFTY